MTERKTKPTATILVDIYLKEHHMAKLRILGINPENLLDNFEIQISDALDRMINRMEPVIGVNDLPRFEIQRSGQEKY